MILLAAVCAAYLLGSIPTGVLVGRLKGIDIRKRGSGNVGATNVARVAGKLPGLLVLLVDAAKGWLPVSLLGPAMASFVHVPREAIQMMLAIAAVAGHIWNPFLQFKGGKGVATGFGVLLGLDVRVGLGSAGVWGLAAFMTQTVSIASISAALAAPFLMAFLGLPTLWILGGIAISLVIIARHRSNLLRLLHGEEPRIGSVPPPS